METTFTADELDAKWREMANSGADDTIVSLTARFDWLAEQYEIKLAELRDYARTKLSEGK